MILRSNDQHLLSIIGQLEHKSCLLVFQCLSTIEDIGDTIQYFYHFPIKFYNILGLFKYHLFPFFSTYWLVAPL